jgi:uncharacterized protein YegL
MRPGGELATRPLHFFFIADASSSMSLNGKMDALNLAIREAIPHMRRVAEDNPNAQVYVRAIRFASGATWHVGEETPVEDFEWEDLKAQGVTDLGKAFDLLAEQMTIPPMSDRALPPVLVLISDGQPTDDYKPSLEKLLRLPWGTKSVRLAIAIGSNASKRVLSEFIASSHIEPLEAHNAKELVEYIRWASTIVLQAASSPATESGDSSYEGGSLIIPQVPSEFWKDISVSVDDVW